MRAKRPRWGGIPTVQLIPDDDFDLLRPRLHAAKEVLWVSRFSKVILARCIPLLVGAWLLGLLSLYLLISHPAIELTLPHFGASSSVPGQPEAQHHVRIGIWWAPMAIALRFLYGAAGTWQRWKWEPIKTLTPTHLIDVHVESALFPEEGRDDDPLPTAQVIQVKSHVGYWGGMMKGFGDLLYKVRTSEVGDTGTWYTIGPLPRVEQLAELLRSVSPAGDLPSGAPILAELDATPTSGRETA
jgi:hypothetical protein